MHSYFACLSDVLSSAVLLRLCYLIFVSTSYLRSAVFSGQRKYRCVRMSGSLSDFSGLCRSPRLVTCICGQCYLTRFCLELKKELTRSARSLSITCVYMCILYIDICIEIEIGEKGRPRKGAIFHLLIISDCPTVVCNGVYSSHQ